MCYMCYTPTFFFTNIPYSELSPVQFMSVIYNYLVNNRYKYTHLIDYKGIFEQWELQ